MRNLDWPLGGSSVTAGNSTAAFRGLHEVLGALRERFEALTPRERTIMIEVTQGRLSKQIAGDLGITEGTVKVHRSNIMKKMRVVSLPELCRIADKLKLMPEQSPLP